MSFLAALRRKSLALVGGRLLAFAVVAAATTSAYAMTPPSNTPLGIPSPNNSSSPSPYTPPFSGQYYLHSPLATSGAIWQVTPAAPPNAADPTCLGAAVVQPLTNGFATLLGQSRGWVRVDVIVNYMVVDTAFYCLYAIEVLEDDVGGRAGYDPRYGAAFTNFPEEGGYYHSSGSLEPASEAIDGWDDRNDGQTTDWTGTPLPLSRSPRRMPEAQLLPQRSHQGNKNSLVATRRDNQYVRVWVHGALENLPIPIYLHCTDNAVGSVFPGPVATGYQVTVHHFVPPLLGGTTPGSWTYPVNVPQDPPLLPVSRHKLLDSPILRRHWIVRIPWKGSSTSLEYGDIEVEVQIPNPSSNAQAYGVDPTGLDEGSMQLRWGTVVELEKLESRIEEPSNLSWLKDRWFRRVRFQLKHQDLVCEPDQVTLALGARADDGRAGREADPAELEVVEYLYDVVSDIRHGPYFDEAMTNVVNEVLETDPEEPFRFSAWVRAAVPADVLEPWFDTSGNPKPAESVKVKLRGYVGTIPNTPAPNEFQDEPAELGPDTTIDEHVHFVNVLADLNHDRVLDAADDGDDDR
jgi:hypothetical protein